MYSSTLFFSFLVGIEPGTFGLEVLCSDHVTGTELLNLITANFQFVHICYSSTFSYKSFAQARLLIPMELSIFRKESKCVVFGFVYFTLDAFYKVKSLFNS